MQRYFARPLAIGSALRLHVSRDGPPSEKAFLLQIQGLEDLLGSFQGAVDGVPAEPSAGVPHASQTYMRIIARARNDAGMLALLLSADAQALRGLMLRTRFGILH